VCQRPRCWSSSELTCAPICRGCSTLLKTICGETHGLFVDDNSYLNYQGISQEMMYTRFRGEAIYTAETDVHFPNVRARPPHLPILGSC
jgi:hypothetical protein